MQLEHYNNRTHHGRHRCVVIEHEYVSCKLSMAVLNRSSNRDSDWESPSRILESTYRESLESKSDSSNLVVLVATSSLWPVPLSSSELCVFSVFPITRVISSNSNWSCSGSKELDFLDFSHFLYHSLSKNLVEILTVTLW